METDESERRKLRKRSKRSSILKPREPLAPLMQGEEQEELTGDQPRQKKVNKKRVSFSETKSIKLFQCHHSKEVDDIAERPDTSKHNLPCHNVLENTDEDEVGVLETWNHTVNDVKDMNLTTLDFTMHEEKTDNDTGDINNSVNESLEETECKNASALLYAPSPFQRSTKKLCDNKTVIFKNNNDIIIDLSHDACTDSIDGSEEKPSAVSFLSSYDRKGDGIAFKNDNDVIIGFSHDDSDSEEKPSAASFLSSYQMKGDEIASPTESAQLKRRHETEETLNSVHFKRDAEECFASLTRTDDNKNIDMRESSTEFFTPAMDTYETREITQTKQLFTGCPDISSFQRKPSFECLRSQQEDSSDSLELTAHVNATINLHGDSTSVKDLLNNSTTERGTTEDDENRVDTPSLIAKMKDLNTTHSPVYNTTEEHETRRCATPEFQQHMLSPLQKLMESAVNTPQETDMTSSHQILNGFVNDFTRNNLPFSLHIQRPIASGVNSGPPKVVDAFATYNDYIRKHGPVHVTQDNKLGKEYKSLEETVIPTNDAAKSFYLQRKEIEYPAKVNKTLPAMIVERTFKYHMEVFSHDEISRNSETFLKNQNTTKVLDRDGTNITDENDICFEKASETLPGRYLEESDSSSNEGTLNTDVLFPPRISGITTPLREGAFIPYKRIEPQHHRSLLLGPSGMDMSDSIPDVRALREKDPKIDRTNKDAETTRKEIGGGDPIQEMDEGSLSCQTCGAGVKCSCLCTDPVSKTTSTEAKNILPGQTNISPTGMSIPVENDPVCLNKTYCVKQVLHNEKSSKHTKQKNRQRTYTIAKGEQPYEDTIVVGNTNSEIWLIDDEVSENSFKVPMANSTMVAHNKDYMLLSDEETEVTNEKAVVDSSEKGKLLTKAAVTVADNTTPNLPPTEHGMLEKELSVCSLTERVKLRSQEKITPANGSLMEILSNSIRKSFAGQNYSSENIESPVVVSSVQELKQKLKAHAQKSQIENSTIDADATLSLKSPQKITLSKPIKNSPPKTKVLMINGASPKKVDGGNVREKTPIRPRRSKRLSNTPIRYRESGKANGNEELDTQGKPGKGCIDNVSASNFDDIGAFTPKPKIPRSPTSAFKSTSNTTGQSKETVKKTMKGSQLRHSYTNDTAILSPLCVSIKLRDALTAKKKKSITGERLKKDEQNEISASEMSAEVSEENVVACDVVKKIFADKDELVQSQSKLLNEDADLKFVIENAEPVGWMKETIDNDIASIRFTSYKHHKLVIKVDGKVITDIIAERLLEDSCTGEECFINMMKKVINVPRLQRTYTTVSQIPDLLNDVSEVVSNWKPVAFDLYKVFKTFLGRVKWNENRVTVGFVIRRNTFSVFSLNIDFNSEDRVPQIKTMLEHNMIYILFDEIKRVIDATIVFDNKPFLSHCNNIYKFCSDVATGSVVIESKLERGESGKSCLVNLMG